MRLFIRDTLIVVVSFGVFPLLILLLVIGVVSSMQDRPTEALQPVETFDRPMQHTIDGTSLQGGKQY